MTYRYIYAILYLQYLTYGGFMHDMVKMSHLIEWSQSRKLKRKDLHFMMTYLSLDQRDQFKKLYKVKEQALYKNDIQGKRIMRKVIAVFDCPELCGELTLAYGRLDSKKRVAVLDTDRLNPVMHMYLNVSHRIKNMHHHLSIDQSTGLNLLIDALHKNQLTPSFSDHMALRIKGLRNVYYFSGSSLIEDYEYFDLNDLKKVVNFLRNHYDVLLLNTNGFIYDAFTCYALMTSDINMLPVKGQFPIIKSLKKNMDFLCQKQNIEVSKNYYLLFDHIWKNQISQRVFKSLMDGQTFTSIPYVKSRHYSQEHVYIPTKRFNHKLQKTYQKTLLDIDRGIKKHEFNQKSSH